MSEATLERAFVRWCERQGVMAIKLSAPFRGWPDRTVIGRGRVVFVELKRPGGRRSPQQQWWIERLKSGGFIAGFAESLDEATALVTEGLAMSSEKLRLDLAHAEDAVLQATNHDMRPEQREKLLHAYLAVVTVAREIAGENE